MRPDVVAVLYEAVKLLRSRMPRAGTDAIIVFLCLCERDGISAKELVFRCGISSCRLSRSLKLLHAPSSGVLGTGLVCAHEQEGDRRCIVIHLTDQGCRLRDHLRKLGSKASPVRRHNHRRRPRSDHNAENVLQLTD